MLDLYSLKQPEELMMKSVNIIDNGFSGTTQIRHGFTIDGNGIYYGVAEYSVRGVNVISSSILTRDYHAGELELGLIEWHFNFFGFAIGYFLWAVAPILPWMIYRQFIWNYRWSDNN